VKRAYPDGWGSPICRLPPGFVSDRSQVKARSSAKVKVNISEKSANPVALNDT